MLAGLREHGRRVGGLGGREAYVDTESETAPGVHDGPVGSGMPVLAVQKQMPVADEWRWQVGAVGVLLGSRYASSATSFGTATRS